MSIQGWIVLLIVAGISAALIRRGFNASKGQSCGGCCGGSCHSPSKKP